MAIIDWTTNFPTAIDTTTQQGTLTNNTDVTRVAQIHALRDAGFEIQAQIGTGSVPGKGNIKQRLDALEASGGAASTLNEAYNSGSGKAIDIDSGPVQLQGASSATLVLDVTGSTKTNGDIEITGSSGIGLILVDSSGTRWRITIDDSGSLNSTSI